MKRKGTFAGRQTVNKRRKLWQVNVAAQQARRMGAVGGVGNRMLAALMRRDRGTRRHEIKFVDKLMTTTNFVTAATPPTAIGVLNLSQGAAGFNRIGQKIILKSIRVRGNVTNILTTTQDIGRIIVVYDHQANAALPLWTDLIGAVNVTGAAGTSAYDGVQLANRERFIVLADEQFNLPAVTNTAGVLTNLAFPQEKNPSMFNFDRFIRLKDLQTHFNNVNGGTFADIQTGSLNIFVVSQNNSNAWAFTYSVRVRFDDL